MDIILLEKVRNLGELGDQVTVRPGYGRNFLIPSGKAVRATAANKAAFDTRRAELEKQQAEALGAAHARAETLQGLELTVGRRASEEGRLFGSVGTADIAEAAGNAGHKLEKAEIVLSQGALKELGDHEVTVSLHPEVELKIRVKVVAES